MKIIEKVVWSLEFTCEKCTSKLCAEEDDVNYESVGSFDEFESNYYVVCAVCSSRHDLTKKEVAKLSARATSASRSKYAIARDTR